MLSKRLLQNLPQRVYVQISLFHHIIKSKAILALLIKSPPFNDIHAFHKFHEVNRLILCIPIKEHEYVNQKRMVLYIRDLGPKFIESAHSKPSFSLSVGCIHGA